VAVSAVKTGLPSGGVVIRPPRSDRTKSTEKDLFEPYGRGAGPLLEVDVEEVRRTLLQPCHTAGGDRCSDHKQAFHELILGQGGWAGKDVPDCRRDPGTRATRGRPPQGEAAIFAPDVREKAARFAQAEIRENTFIRSVKRFGGKRATVRVGRAIRRDAKADDGALSAPCPAPRGPGCFPGVVPTRYAGGLRL